MGHIQRQTLADPLGLVVKGVQLFAKGSNRVLCERLEIRGIGGNTLSATHGPRFPPRTGAFLIEETSFVFLSRKGDHDHFPQRQDIDYKDVTQGMDFWGFLPIPDGTRPEEYITRYSPRRFDTTSTRNSTWKI